MDDLPRQTLVRMIHQYGTGLVDDPRRLEEWLNDLCGERKREIRALLDAVRERVARDLRDAKGGMPPEVLAANLTRRLLDATPMSEEMARWAVESWAEALGITLPSVRGRVAAAIPAEVKPQVIARGAHLQTRKTPPLAPRRNGLFLVGLGLLVLLVAAMIALADRQGWLRAAALVSTDTATPEVQNTQTLAPATPTLVRTTPPVTLTAAVARTFTPTRSTSLPFTATPASSLAQSAMPPTCTVMGQKWVSPVDGMTLVCVPAGKFMMGAADSDLNALADERPLHEVTLDAFWLDQTEVTNAMYAGCVVAKGCSAPSSSASETRPSYFGNSAYANYPVIYVTWLQSKTYCEWAGRKLPTEAQWEKAARGTDGRIYPWGNQPAELSRVNHSKTLGDTTEVGKYPTGASPYGALEMAGNVMEWVADWYGPYVSTAVTNPTGPTTGTQRVMRGGTWYGASAYVRATVRAKYEPGMLGSVDGFRCAR